MMGPFPVSPLPHYSPPAGTGSRIDPAVYAAMLPAPRATFVPLVRG